MLPFIDSKKSVGHIMSQRIGKPAVELKAEKMAEGGEVDPAIQSVGEDLLAAIESKSAIDIAKALHAAFQIYESMPHEEYEPSEEGPMGMGA